MLIFTSEQYTENELVLFPKLTMTRQQTLMTFLQPKNKKKEIPFGNGGNYKTDYVCVCV